MTKSIAEGVALPGLAHRLPARIRRWVLVLGDQLWLENPAIAAMDPATDAVLMIEAPGESEVVWSHKARTALFLSAMRHFCNELHQAQIAYLYVRLDEVGFDSGDLLGRLTQILKTSGVLELHACEAGEWRLEQGVADVAQQCGAELAWHADTHFMSSRAEFAAWAAGKKELRMEYFYRDMRKKHQVLMQADKPKEPVGGQWNFDADNRKPYPKTGPGDISPPALFKPDATTQEVFALVEKHLPNNPGSLDNFIWPVTREQALGALDAFVNTRLKNFGPYQDAMWTNTPYGWHALLSTSLNLHLLNPREVVAAAQAAYERGEADLAGVEGFIRQVMGWREFIRGVYWYEMPKLKTDNFYGHTRNLPKWYWTGETGMACMKDTVGQTLQHGFAHHIQRLMVTGQFALLAEISPQQVADWYLAVYVDAVEWVELPNVAGMALFANGGRFTSKPYIASGQYIKRQSNYCKGCRYQPEERVGDAACPVTTLFWNFLDKHEAALSRNPRTVMMAKNITRLSDDQRQAIREQAQRQLNNLDAL
jgi:deoxyribodipyrimidine photolyase-related protein